MPNPFPTFFCSSICYQSSNFFEFTLPKSNRICPTISNFLAYLHFPTRTPSYLNLLVYLNFCFPIFHNIFFLSVCESLYVLLNERFCVRILLRYKYFYTPWVRVMMTSLCRNEQEILQEKTCLKHPLYYLLHRLFS